MVSDLKLSGTDLIVYAIIFGFSQDGKSTFHGGSSYLIEWTNASKNTVLSSLKFLCLNGLITKSEQRINGAIHSNYKCTKSRIAPVQKLVRGGAKIGTPPVQKLVHPLPIIGTNNKEYNKVNKKEEESKKEKFDYDNVQPFVKKSREETYKQKLAMETDFYAIVFEDQIWQETTAMLLKIPSIQKLKYLYSCFYCYQKNVGKKHDNLVELRKNFMNWAKPYAIEEKMKEFKSGRDVFDIVIKWANNNREDILISVNGLPNDEIGNKIYEFVYGKYNSIDMAIFIQSPIQVFKKEFPDFISNNKVLQTI